MKLYKVRPKTPVGIHKPAYLEIPSPPALVFVSYGFNSFQLSLKHVHPDPFDQEKYQEAFELLCAKTDVDHMICPREQTLRYVCEEGGANYFHAIERAVKGPKCELTVPIATHGNRAPRYLHFTHESVDYSLETLPLHVYLYSSTQALYDPKEDLFIFKNELCYLHYCRREIISPSLDQLLQRSKRNKITLGTTVFLLKNNLKMRCIGWTLSQQDRETLEAFLHDEEFEETLTKINAGLQKELVENESITRLLNELGKSEINLQLLLEQRPNEAVKKCINYALYPRATKIDEIVQDLQDLCKKVTCSEAQRTQETQDVCDQLLSDPRRSDDEKRDFVERMEPALLKNVVIPKEWFKKSITVEIKNTPKTQALFTENQFQNDPKISLLEKSLKKERDEVEEDYNNYFDVNRLKEDCAATRIQKDAIREISSSYFYSPWMAAVLVTFSTTTITAYYQFYPENKDRLIAYNFLTFIIGTFSLLFINEISYQYFLRMNLNAYARSASKYSIESFQEILSISPKKKNTSILLTALAIHAMHFLCHPNKDGKYLPFPERFTLDNELKSVVNELQWVLKNAGFSDTLAPLQALQFITHFALAQRVSHINDLWNSKPKIILSDHSPNPDAQFNALIQEIRSGKRVDNLQNILNAFLRDIVITGEPRYLDYYENTFPALMSFLRQTEPLSRSDIGIRTKLLYMPLTLFLNDKNSGKLLANDLNMLSNSVLKSQIRPVTVFEKHEFFPSVQTVSSRQPIQAKDRNLFVMNYYISKVASSEVWKEYSSVQYFLFVFIAPMLTMGLASAYLKMNDPEHEDNDLIFLLSLFIAASVAIHFILKENHLIVHKKKYSDSLVTKATQLLFSAHRNIANNENIHGYALYTLCTMIRHPFDEGKMVTAMVHKTNSLPNDEFIFKNLAYIYRFITKCCRLKFHDDCQPLVHALLSQIAAQHNIALEKVWFIDLSELCPGPSLIKELQETLLKASLSMRNQLVQNKLALHDYAKAYARLVIERIEISPSTLILPSLEAFIQREIATASKNPSRMYLLYTDPLSLYAQSDANRHALAMDLNLSRPKPVVV